MDSTRIGIYGHSHGGYESTRALLAHSKSYHVAVSSAGNHDHRYVKAAYMEQWRGYPQGPDYRRDSNVVNAHKLEGKLLLIHGDMDMNVNLSTSTMRLVAALVRANKDFDLIIIPGAPHGIGGSYHSRKLRDFFVRHLHGIEPTTVRPERRRR